MMKYYPCKVTGINPKTARKETFEFAGKSGLDKAEKKKKELQTRGYRQLEIYGKTCLSELLVL